VHQEVRVVNDEMTVGDGVPQADETIAVPRGDERSGVGETFAVACPR
jgi:hypothetical protein